ncbi:MAG TPA: P1 family peptidase [Alphaproteobacteria bacterium]|nr:P1 family peptidase [Alphaproteobacteria bacterium]
MSQGLRARDLGLPFSGIPGPFNAVTDVPGVLVGATTIVEGDGPLVAGRGPVRTGVTAILPSGREGELVPVWAGFHSFNGNGEMTGTHWIDDAGYLVGPICITNTHSVGMVHHAATKWMIHTYPAFHEHHLWAMPVVAETYDGLLNDINGQHVREEHVLRALDTATGGPVPEGNVGGGTGMICYEFKGGTGTSSRQITIDGTTHTVGALVQANHGQRDWLTILGVPVGKHLVEDRISWREQGSIIVVIGTDVPLLPTQLKRLAKRASIGISRHGTPGGNNSGDIFLAFSTVNRGPLHGFAPAYLTLRALNDEQLNSVYLAAVEAIEEAVVNAMVAARDTPTLRPPGRICRAIPHDRLVEVMRAYNRCA